MAMNPPIEQWAGHCVWLVGASSGIGEALARQLLQAGARVAVSARQAEPLRALAARHPGQALALPLDVTDRAAVTEAARRLDATLGPPDLVVYCAGTYTPMRADGLDLDTLLQHQQVNYVGALHVLDAVLPGMLARAAGGNGTDAPARIAPHISLVASVAGYRGLPQALAYGPTKAALIHLAETLHLDLRPRGIGVSVINPGFVETPLTAQNRFRMPALISTAEATRQILKGWARGEFEIHFPKRFSRLLKLLGLLPDRLYFAAVRRATGL